MSVKFSSMELSQVIALASHPGMTYAEVLRAWKAKKRGKHLSDPNTMAPGNPHL